MRSNLYSLAQPSLPTEKPPPRRDGKRTTTRSCPAANDAIQYGHEVVTHENGRRP